MNRAIVLVTIVAAAATASCKKKREGAAADPSVHVEPVTKPVASRPADPVLDHAFTRVVKPFSVVRAALRYVRADGTFDGTYGEAVVEFGYHFDDPNDDPKRPIGAPVVPFKPPAAPATCPRVVYKAGQTDDPDAACFEGTGLTARPSCTLAKLWLRAIDDGAPANALASFTLTPSGWQVAIDDEPRKLHWKHDYSDASCANAPDKALPAEAGGTPDVVVDKSTKKNALTSSEIMDSLAKVKAQIVACGGKSPAAHGIVKIAVKVAPGGAPTIVTPKQSPDPKLAACVAKVATSMPWPKTTAGGSFTVPFTF